jgi:DNA-directed RNA polymerase subunit K/omega
MTQALAKDETWRAGESLALSVFGAERVAVLKEQLSRGWKEPMTDAELEHIALVYQRNHLDPLAKPPQIYWIKRWDGRLGKEVMGGQVAVHGLRLIAQRSREWAGLLGPYWTADGKEWLDVWLSNEAPAAAKVAVMRKGFSEPVWSTATWREWAQYVKDAKGNRVLTPFWASMPANMLAKTAEAHALARAFPQETSDLEIAAADAEWRQQQQQLSQRYDEILGPDVYELPERTVDRRTGEVLEEKNNKHASAQDLTTPEPSGAAADPASPSPAPPEHLVDKYRRNRELVRRARELHLDGFEPLALGNADDVVEAANLELEDRIARFEFEHGEVERQRASEGLL